MAPIIDAEPQAQKPLKVKIKASTGTDAPGISGKVGTVVAVSPSWFGLPPVLVVEFGPGTENRFHIREPLCEVVRS